MKQYKVKKGDGFPNQICSECQAILTQSYSFKLQCEKSQEVLLKCGANNVYIQESVETNEHQEQLVCVHCNKKFSSKNAMLLKNKLMHLPSCRLTVFEKAH